MTRGPAWTFERIEIAGNGLYLPPQTSKLFAPDLPQTHTSMGSIAMARYGEPQNFATGSTCGEIWLSVAKAPAVDGTKAVRVDSGTLQLYVLTPGTAVFNKNGSDLLVRNGEKISFTAGDTFTVTTSQPTYFAVVNEGAAISLAAPVIRSLAELKLPAIPARPFQSYARPQHLGDTSSRGFARSRAG